MVLAADCVASVNVLSGDGGCPECLWASINLESVCVCVGVGVGVCSNASSSWVLGIDNGQQGSAV